MPTPPCGSQHTDSDPPAPGAADGGSPTGPPIGHDFCCSVNSTKNDSGESSSTERGSPPEHAPIRQTRTTATSTAALPINPPEDRPGHSGAPSAHHGYPSDCQSLDRTEGTLRISFQVVPQRRVRALMPHGGLDAPQVGTSSIEEPGERASEVMRCDVSDSGTLRPEGESVTQCSSSGQTSRLTLNKGSPS